MPCSLKVNPVQVLNERTGDLQRQDRWQAIRETLTVRFTSSLMVKRAILKYNSAQSPHVPIAKKLDLTALDLYCTKVLQPDAADHLLGVLLPDMAQLALRLPELCTKPIPYLKKGMNHSITMSQEQVACLLANAFFCTFPRRNSRKSEYHNYPDINFSRYAMQ